MGNGQFTEIVVYEIPRTQDFPQGLKYSMSFIRKGKCILRYDNEKTKGHHMHLNGKEIPIEFIGIDTLIEDFESHVEKIRGVFDETSQSDNQDWITSWRP